MTGPEISKLLRKMMWDRTDEIRKRMAEYDDEMNSKTRELQELCPHEDDENWQSNGLGFYWTNCRWCGKRMQTSKLPDGVVE